MEFVKFWLDELCVLSSPKFYRTTFKSISKYFALVFLFKLEVKFVNFCFKFYLTETRILKMSNLNLRRFASAKLCRHISRAVGVERAWERKGRRFVSRTPFLSRRKEKSSSLVLVCNCKYGATQISS